MEIVYERIFVSHEHSFITRKMQMNTNLHKVHSHKNFELNYITAGSGKRIVGNSIKPYAEGDLVLMDPTYLIAGMPWEEGIIPECIVTHFYENLISSDFFNIPELEEVENF